MIKSKRQTKLPTIRLSKKNETKPVSENEHMIQKNIFYVSTLYRFGMNIDLYNMTGRSLKSFFKKKERNMQPFLSNLRLIGKQE